MNEFKTNDCLQIDTRSSFKPSVKHCTIIIIWIKLTIHRLNLGIPIILYEREGKKKNVIPCKLISLKGGSHAQITLFMVNFSVLQLTKSPDALVGSKVCVELATFDIFYTKPDSDA